MISKMTQFRYFGKKNKDDNGNSLNNMPFAVDNDDTSKYKLDLIDTYAPITYLGIQSIPGAKFWLNNTNNEGIIIGASGIYQLDLTNSTGAIDVIYIDKTVIEIIDKVYSQDPVKLNNLTAHLIIDIVYEGEGSDDVDEDVIIDGNVKLYNTTGYNTDGAMTQRAVTTVLDSMAHSYDNETLIIPE